MTILLGLFVVLLLALVFTIATNQRWIGANKAFVLWVITSALVVLSPLVIEYPTKQTPISFEADGSIHKHPYGMLHSPFAHKSFSRLPEGLEPLVGSVTVITDNPKVRTISYTLKVEIADLETFFSREERRWPTAFSKFNDWDDLDGFQGDTVPLELATEMDHRRYIDGVVYQPVVELMYKFNNSQSQGLSEFYNPAAESQQKEFKKLTESWFNSRLKDEGLKITFKSFGVE